MHTSVSMLGAAQEWSEDPAALRAWQRGRTGFPLVDAGMRQLWQAGWMQQSIRMVCAAFLTEYLSMHWLHGCRRALPFHPSNSGLSKPCMHDMGIVGGPRPAHPAPQCAPVLHCERR